MWYLYIIESLKDQVHYTGISQSIDRRILEHNSGKNRFTKGHMPWVLIYSETFDSAEEARIREKYFKSGAGRRFIKEKIKGGLGSPPA